MQRLEEQQTLRKLGLPFKDSDTEFLVRILPNCVFELLHFSLFPYVAIWLTLHHIVTNLEVIEMFSAYWVSSIFSGLW